MAELLAGQIQRMVVRLRRRWRAQGNARVETNEKHLGAQNEKIEEISEELKFKVDTHFHHVVIVDGCMIGFGD